MTKCPEVKNEEHLDHELLYKMLLLSEVGNPNDFSLIEFEQDEIDVHRGLIRLCAAALTNWNHTCQC